VLVNRSGGVLLVFGIWPPRVVTDEGTKLKLDSRAVGYGVLGNAFKRVETANADVNALTAELVHGPGEAIGDLTLREARRGSSGPGLNGWCPQQHCGQSLPVPTVYFDEPVAERYDADFADMFQLAVVDPAASFLARLAGDGRALELGIGTGRIAVPLRQRGVRVHGIDLSSAMITRLRAKPGAAGIGVTIGDFTTTRAGGTFRLAYLVFNTIMSLTTQDQQAECFRNAAAQLEPGGCFVIEVMVPALRRLPPGQTVVPFQVTATGWGYDVYDAATQAITANYVRITDGRGEHATFPGRYVWPAELDLMAQLAGMTLRERWGGWRNEPFTSETTTHISVWQKST